MSTPISPNLQQIIDDLANTPEIVALGGSHSVEHQNLVTAITTSPALIDQLNQAVAQKHLTQFGINDDPNAGATYDRGHMNLGLSTLRDASLKPKIMGDLVFQIGHEAQHGFHAAATKQGYQQFNTQVEALAKSAAPTHDYTPALRKMLAVNGHDEASAEVAGWNALVSYVKQTDPKPSLETLYKASAYSQDFIDYNGTSYTLKPNITLNADMTMAMNESNINGMKENYFDQIPTETRLGSNGDSDYTNYYSTYMISTIAQAEQSISGSKHKLVIDMASLKLDEKLLEQNGLTIADPSGRQAYYDKSAPKTQKHFDHTVDTHVHIPIVKPHGPVDVGQAVPSEHDTAKAEQIAPLSFWDKLVQASKSDGTEDFFNVMAEHAQSKEGQERSQHQAERFEKQQQEQAQTRREEEKRPEQEPSPSQQNESQQSESPKRVLRH